jgi:hypothetical protein
MQLDFVEDDMGDHTSLDDKVCALFRSDRNKPPPFAAAILCYCAACAPDKFDQKFRNLSIAMDIVAAYSLDPGGDENSNLAKLLHWCWRLGTFKKIRCLSEHSFDLVL